MALATDSAIVPDCILAVNGLFHLEFKVTRFRHNNSLIYETEFQHPEMAEIEERPSKIRKLDSEHPNGSVPAQSSALDSNEKYDPTSIPPEHEEKYQDQIDVQEEAENKPAISKSQLKKLRKQELWEKGKEDRKAKRKEQRKAKQARKAEARTELQAKVAGGEVDPEPTESEDAKKKRPRRPIQIPVALILDCDFNELMTEKELISLGAQLTRCYSVNKTSPYRTHMAISSWGGKLQSRFENVLASNHLQWRGMRFAKDDFQHAAQELDGVMRSPSGGKLVGALAPKYEDLKAHETEGHYVMEVKKTTESTETTFITGRSIDSLDSTVDSRTSVTVASSIPKSSKDTSAGLSLPPSGAPGVESSIYGLEQNSEPQPSMVYLTADSPNTLDVLLPNTSYIIGGIVDKNRHKGICYKRACERDIPTAKLPIGEYMTMQSRSVLAVNHVVEIMLKWLETGDWGEAFLSVIPKRKEPKLRAKKEDSQEKGSSAKDQSENEDELLDESRNGIQDGDDYVELPDEDDVAMREDVSGDGVEGGVSLLKNELDDRDAEGEIE
jgi:tRNA (guanine9-N1)-methyltransferase